MFISLARALGATLYIFVDLIYVIGSKSFYDPAIVALNSGQPHDVSLVYIGCAYLSMIIGWLSFAAPKVDELQSLGWDANSAALIAGFLYSIAVYGVFNFTLGLMAGPWTLPIILRDLSWCLLWSVGSLRLYLLIKTYF